MRILQINSHYDQGGAARIVACIHRQLSEEGQEAFVAYGRGNSPAERNTYCFDKPPEIYASALWSRLSGLNGWGNRLATRRLLRYIDRINPQVVHLHAIHGYYLNFVMLFQYLDRKQIPCVWTFHDCHAFVGNCGYFFDCRQWESGCKKCPYLQNYPASLFFDWTGFMWRRKKELFTQGKRVIVTPSEWMAEEVKKSFFKNFPCITVRNGIDTEHIFYPRDRRQCREKYGFMPEEPLVLGVAVGYHDPRKGVKYIIQMAKDMGNDVKVILIGWEGKGDDSLRDSDNIIPLTVTVDLNQLAEYYSMADVFVLPSLAENYATVSLEAMACGTPVVGFDTGGTPEQLAGCKGIAVPAGDQEAFTGAVRKALFGKCGLLRGEELAKVIRQENSIEKMTKQYMEIYQSLVMDKVGKR